MTPTDRYMELLALAEDANAAEVLVTAADWYVLTQCAGSANLIKHAGGTPSYKIDGCHFRRKPRTQQPHGTLDLTGPEPALEA